MNFLAILANPKTEKFLLGLALLIALALGYVFWHSHVYKQGIAAEKALWDADTAARQKAEAAAIETRLRENAAALAMNEQTNAALTKAHNDEISNLRAAVAAAPRLRIGSAICGRSASPPATAGTAGSAAADPAAGLVRPDIGRDIDALKIQVEEAFAAGRTCQEWVKAQGFAGQ